MEKKHPAKKYPMIGACGLNCGLCPRYYTDGPSRCPGCCGPGFWQKHPPCRFITCCVKEKGLETCAQCGDWPECKKVARTLGWAKQHDSVLSYKPLESNFAAIQRNGIEEFTRLEEEKMALLRHLIDNYNDGRSKGFYCTSCQLVPLEKLKQALEAARIEITEGVDIKERAKILRAAITSMADSLGIDLKLRK